MKYSLVKQIAEHLVLNLAESCLRIEPAGSFLRKKAECGDLEILCIPRPGAPRPEFGTTRIYASWIDQALHRLECEGFLGRREKDGPKYKKIHIITDRYGIACLNVFALDLFIVRPETWGVQKMIRTGPAEFSRSMVTPVSSGGLMPDGLKIGDGLLWEGENVIPTPEEADLFKAFNMRWLDPEKRI
jgi:DNA polymerase/3'-5' exonuclease PolX